MTSSKSLMTSSKSLLRKRVLQERKRLSHAEYEKRNNLLMKQIQELIIRNEFKTIHTFLPIVKNREPDITSLFESWWKAGRQILVSKTDFQSKQMTHYWLTSQTTIRTSLWGIPEPIDARLADIKKAELIIVPLLIGDIQGNRIGYGGGYYDRLLKDFHGYSTGLSLLPQIDQIKTEDQDIPLDLILTP